MEPISLHPFDPTIAVRFVAMLTGEESFEPDWSGLMPTTLVDDLAKARSGDESASNRITLAFARIVAAQHPTYFHDGLGLTTWEARVDRGIGMLMRPPSRLFIDAGLERKQVEAMPIRLDLQGGLMGGAWIPPRLMGNLRELLDTRLDRLARRLHEAEYDPYALLGLMDSAVTYAAERNLGLFEAIGVVGPYGEHSAGIEVIAAEPKRMNQDLLRRIEIAITPPKKPGLISRMLGRGHVGSNGHISDDVI